MTDDYIYRHKKRILKRVQELLSIKLLALFGICVLSLAILCGINPPPQRWQSATITIVEKKFQNRIKPTANYSPGYQLTDQNGNIYWIDGNYGEITVGESYSVRYFTSGDCRFLRSVVQEDTVLMDYNNAVDQWNQDVCLLALVLVVFVWSLVGTVRSIKGLLSDAEIRQCKEKIQKHMQKMN